MEKYDLIVIGGGVGLTLADAGLSNGMKVALIEKSKLGGTCLTRGCIPSKVLVTPADMIKQSAHAAKYGVNTKFEGFDWEKISKRMWSQIDQSIRIEKSVKSLEDLTLYKGSAEFVSDKVLRVKKEDGSYTEQITGDIIVVAPGAVTYVPEIKGLEESGYVTSESFFGEKFFKDLPESIALLGAGAIGAEFTHIFSAFGVKVHLIEQQSRILPLEEPDISKFVTKAMKKDGVEIYTSNRLIEAQRLDDGSKKIVLQNIDSKNKTEIIVDEIFVASGVRPNTDDLKLENTSIKLNSKGWIVTDEYLRTSAEGIWALGDINGLYQFRHKANYEADIAVYNIFNPYGKMKKVEYFAVPWAVFTYPEVAHVGMTLEEALAEHKGVYLGVKHYSSIAKGFALGYEAGADDDGFVKLIADKDYKILGAHIVGYQASVLIQPYVYLMNAGCTCVAGKSKRFGRKEEQQILEDSAGGLNPIMQSMVIHPALSELTAWVVGEMKWVEP